MRFAVVAMAMALGAACNAADVASMETVEVTTGAITPRLVLSGTVGSLSPEVVNVPQTGSWELQISWMIESGKVAKAGEKVLEFDNSQLLSQVLEAELAVLGAENDLIRQRASNRVSIGDKEVALERARITLEKSKLDADVPEDTVARRAYQEKQLALAKATIAFETAADDLATQKKIAEHDTRIKELALRKAERLYAERVASLEKLALKSPIEGVAIVGNHPWEGRPFERGDTVRPGWSVITFPDPDALSVNASLSDVDDGWVVPGLQVECILDAYPELSIPGRVVAVSPVARPASRRSLRREFNVEIELESGANENVRPGMSVQVVVRRPPMEDAWKLPRAAINFERRVAIRDDGSEIPLADLQCDAHFCGSLDPSLEGARLRLGGNR